MSLSANFWSSTLTKFWDSLIAFGDWVQLIAQQYLTITWNYVSGTVLQPGASQTITITIIVNQYVTGLNTFTNTIYVIATQSS